MTGPPLYTLLLAVGVALCIAITVLAWRHRPTPGAVPLAGLSFGAAIWALATLAQVIVGDYAASLFWGRVVYLGIAIGGTCWFVLAMEYSGKEQYLQWPFVCLLAVEPILINALVWTNRVHELVWNSVEPSGSIYGFTVEYGLAFWVHSAYSYLLLGVGSLLVLGQLYQNRSIYRGQAVAMFVSALAPWAGNMVFLSELTAADWAPIGFVVSCLALFWAMTTRSLVDVTPVARNTVLDRIPSGVAVVDTSGRVLDVNAEMATLLDGEYNRLVGTSVDDAFAGWPTLRETVSEQREGSHDIALAADGETRHFDVEIDPLIDDLDRRIGRIVLVHDVTDQRRREQELERQNEQLDRFTEVLSHDLRNPLNVAEGYLDMVEETGDLEHVDRIRSAHGRMGNLIEDVRTLVKHGQTISEPTRIALSDVARAAAANVDTRSADVRIDDDLGAVEADENRLLHAFENLFRNSVEHGAKSSPGTPRAPGRPETGGVPAGTASGDSPDGERGDRSDGAVASAPESEQPEPAGSASDEVTIRVGRIDGAPPERAGFFVADDGPGIPADEREKIFESGYTTGHDGTGLGLAIVQNAIHAHGWEIDVAESDGGGEASVASRSSGDERSESSGGARFEVTGVSFLDE